MAAAKLVKEGFAEGFRGDVLAWVRLDGQRVTALSPARPIVAAMAPSRSRD
jgi:hypothetical protein